MHFDVESRRNKARKIITLIDRERALLGCTVLEIGTGAGVVSAELARATGPGGAVVSIDTMDSRVDKQSYDFELTAGVALPFPDAAFDVVVSNHVVEHVGDRTDQQVHLAELHRVLRPDGIGYIATPTRWALIEPHFKVPLLSWPPRSMRDRYVRLAGRGRVYDVDPLGPCEIRAALSRAGLEWHDKTLDALDELVRVENPTGAARLLAAAPRWVRRAARPALPTMVYLVRPR